LGELFADGRRPGFGGGRADHFCALRCQFGGDSRADAAAGAGDQGDLAREFLAHL
jgi:hypothetical protein